MIVALAVRAMSAVVGVGVRMAVVVVVVVSSVPHQVHMGWISPIQPLLHQRHSVSKVAGIVILGSGSAAAISAGSLRQRTIVILGRWCKVSLQKVDVFVVRSHELVFGSHANAVELRSQCVGKCLATVQATFVPNIPVAVPFRSRDLVPRA